MSNVIERCFGIWKARWSILKLIAPFPFETERLIVVASMAIYNFKSNYRSRVSTLWRSWELHIARNPIADNLVNSHNKRKWVSYLMKHATLCVCYSSITKILLILVALLARDGWHERENRLFRCGLAHGFNHWKNKWCVVSPSGETAEM